MKVWKQRLVNFQILVFLFMTDKGKTHLLDCHWKIYLWTVEGDSWKGIQDGLNQ